MWIMQKSFLFGFRKHDNEFLAAPNYVLLKVLKKGFAFPGHIRSVSVRGRRS